MTRRLKKINKEAAEIRVDLRRKQKALDLLDGKVKKAKPKETIDEPKTEMPTSLE